MCLLTNKIDCEVFINIVWDPQYLLNYDVINPDLVTWHIYDRWYMRYARW